MISFLRFLLQPKIFMIQIYTMNKYLQYILWFCIVTITILVWYAVIYHTIILPRNLAQQEALANQKQCESWNNKLIDTQQEYENITSRKSQELTQQKDIKIDLEKKLKWFQQQKAQSIETFRTNSTKVIDIWRSKYQYSNTDNILSHQTINSNYVEQLNDNTNYAIAMQKDILSTYNAKVWEINKKYWLLEEEINNRIYTINEEINHYCKTL